MGRPWFGMRWGADHHDIDAERRRAINVAAMKKMRQTLEAYA